MKKYFLLGMLSPLLFLFGCSSEGTGEEVCDLMTLAELDFVGEVHNEYLNYANIEFPNHDIFKGSHDVVSLRKLEVLSNYVGSSYLHENLFIDETINIELVENFSGVDLYSEYRDGIVTSLDHMISIGDANNIDKEIVLGLIDFLKVNPNSYTEVVNKITEYEIIWKAQGFTKCSLEGRISGFILSIARHSYFFWEHTPEALHTIHNLGTEKLWGFIAKIAFRDVMGGFGGIIVNEFTAGPATSGRQFAAIFIGSAVMSSISPW